MNVEETATRSESPLCGAGAGTSGLGLLWIFPHEAPTLTVLDRPSFVLGRSSQCDVQLSTHEVSRAHARIDQDGSLWVIRDLKSKNGVHLDGKQVDSAVLRSGAILRVGGAVAVITATNVLQNGTAFRELSEGLFGGARFAGRLRHARDAAATALPVILEAPTGCGKERVARAIHEWSGRRGEFVAVNCAAVPENLAEAELFGYRRGAFTGADRNHPGSFRWADGGTLFLDEVLDLPASVQAKLLRTVEQREVVPLGESSPVKVDARIIVASQSSLRRAAETGRIRPDLYARLNGITVTIPPLSERMEDVPYLFRLFARRAAGGPAFDLEAKTVERLCLYRWTLNVRELESLAARLVVVFRDARLLTTAHLEHEVGLSSAIDRAEPAVEGEPAFDSHESSAAWKQLMEALRSSEGNVVRAARRLGISRQRAYRLMAMHPGFDVSTFRAIDGGRRDS